jgi:hypothetical protein
MVEEYSEPLRFYNLHPPDEVRVFSIPARAIRYRDSRRLVYDLRVGDLVLRQRASFAITMR